MRSLVWKWSIVSFDNIVKSCAESLTHQKRLIIYFAFHEYDGKIGILSSLKWFKHLKFAIVDEILLVVFNDNRLASAFDLSVVDFAKNTIAQLPFNLNVFIQIIKVVDIIECTTWIITRWVLFYFLEYIMLMVSIIFTFLHIRQFTVFIFLIIWENIFI